MSSERVSTGVSEKATATSKNMCNWLALLAYTLALRLRRRVLQSPATHTCAYAELRRVRFCQIPAPILLGQSALLL